MISEPEPAFIEKAIQLAIQNVPKGGGPFGAVVVKDGVIISTGVNRVTARHDPTAHAEIVAIRRACKKLKNFELIGCDLYASCEPCPMCFSAIYWSRILRTFYAAKATDAASAGFDDRLIYNEIRRTDTDLRRPITHFPHPEFNTPFELWHATQDKTPY